MSLLKQTNSDQIFWSASWLSKGLWSQGPNSTLLVEGVLKHTWAPCERHSHIYWNASKETKILTLPISIKTLPLHCLELKVCEEGKVI